MFHMFRRGNEGYLSDKLLVKTSQHVTTHSITNRNPHPFMSDFDWSSLSLINTLAVRLSAPGVDLIVTRRCPPASRIRQYGSVRGRMSEMRETWMMLELVGAENILVDRM